MFQGASYIALDAKGRLSIPMEYREALAALAAGHLTVTRHPHGCLLIFPRPAWERFRERIAKMAMSSQWIKRLLLGHARDVDMDATGRILIAPELRSKSDLSKDVVLLGMGEHFELWDRQRYETEEAQQVAQSSAAGGEAELVF